MNYKNTLYILAIISSALYAGESTTVEYNHENCSHLSAHYFKILATEGEKVTTFELFSDPSSPTILTRVLLPEGIIHFSKYQDNKFICNRELAEENFKEIEALIKKCKKEKEEKQKIN